MAPPFSGPDAPCGAMTGTSCGLRFRWFMCSGILFVGLLVAVCEGHLKLGVPPSVVVGGALWALSNFEAWLNGTWCSA